MSKPNVLVHMTSQRKYRNKNEWTSYPKLTCPEFSLEVSGWGRLERQMASLLHENKCDISRGYEVRKGGTLCWEVVPLESWLFSEDRRPEWLKKNP